MAKMGRPTLEKTRGRNLGVRMTDEEYLKLKEYALKHEMTITQVLLEGVNLLYQKIS